MGVITAEDYEILGPFAKMGGVTKNVTSLKKLRS